MSLSWDELGRYFGQMGDQLGRMSFKEPLRDVGLYLAQMSKLNFVGRHEPDGTPWKPFARTPSRRRGGATAKLLQSTDTLMASVVGKAFGHYDELTDWSLTWGTEIDYAGFHQDGTKHIPARPFIGITQPMEERIAQILLWHVEKRLGFFGGQQAA